MKLSDYVMSFLLKKNIKTIFGVTGGAVVHLFDSAQKCGLDCVFTHHEQSAAFAAQAYARIHGLGAGIFTTGPGGTNGVTGIAAAWLDSIPTIYLGGQVRSNHIKSPYQRQQGVQELDILSIVSPIVKYAVTLKNSLDIRYELEKCFYFATTGRPGPVYLEIPLDFQWATIEEGALRAYQPFGENTSAEKHEQTGLILTKLFKAKRPLLLLGHGIRLANALVELDEFLKCTKIPYVTTWNMADGVDRSDPLNLGRPGMFGCRSANIALQTCDFLCCLGTHLSSAITTPNFDRFAPNAEIAVVNIDQNELNSLKVKVHHPLQLDVKVFLKQALAAAPKKDLPIDDWQQRCSELVKRFQYESIKSNLIERIDAYKAISELNESLDRDDIIVVDGGGTIVQIAFQMLSIQKGQRCLIDAGLCAMGSGIPQAIGAAFARKGKGRIICLCGDGSFQFNVQELQTIYHHQLPIKLFIFNNSGYLSIRHTQRGFLEGNYLGSTEQGGISVPDILAVAGAYKIPNCNISCEAQLKRSLRDTLGSKGPALCEILIPVDQEIHPKIGFIEEAPGRFVAKSLEDMWPYLSKEELNELTFVKEKESTFV